MLKPECENELDWSAFCYAAGELAPAQAAAFEERLAADQAAREALARAVELTQAVAAAETLEPVVVVRSERSLWGRRLAWMAVGSAASILIAALISGSGISSRLSAWLQNSPAAAADTGELAVAWSQTRQELSVASDAGLWFPDHLGFPDHLEAVSSEAESSEAASEDTSEDSAVAATPSWLTAAVLSSAGLPVEEN